MGGKIEPKGVKNGIANTLKKPGEVIRCYDGFMMRVIDCTPKNSDGPYPEMEVRWPNRLEELLLSYVAAKENVIPDTLSTTYLNVPVQVILDIISAHADICKQGDPASNGRS